MKSSDEQTQTGSNRNKTALNWIKKSGGPAGPGPGAGSGAGPGADHRRLDFASSVISGCLDPNPDHGSGGQTDLVETLIFISMEMGVFPAS